MTKHIERIAQALIGASFFVPLIMSPKYFIFPFIVPKIIIFRMIVLLLVGCYLLLAAADWERYRPRLTPITIGVLLFITSFGISTFAGVDWYRSFWDNHERMLGFFTVFHYVLYYLIVTALVRSWQNWQWLLRVFLFAGTIVMAIALVQQFNPDLLLNRSGNRSAATLGNPIYVGGYGLFLAFLGWILAIYGEKQRAWRSAAAVMGVFGVVGIFLSGTRGAFLGLCAGAGVLAVLYLITLKDHPMVRRVIGITLAAGVLILSTAFVFRKNVFVHNFPVIGSLVNLSLSSGTASTRLMAWEIALESWRERPVFGWGPSNYYYAFNQFYRPQFLEHGWNETWFDNAHNIILNTLSERGAVGLVFYLALFALVVVTAQRARRAGRLNLHLAHAAIGFMAAHLVQAAFVFENPTSYLYFFFFLAFINAQILGEGEASEASAARLPARQVPAALLGLTVLVVLLLVYATNVNPARANIATLRTLRSLYRFENPLAEYQAASAIPTPHIDDIRNDFARTVFSVMPTYVENGQKEFARELALFTSAELKKNIVLHPLDIRTHLQLAQLAEISAQLLNQVDLLVAAEPVMEQAVRYSPRRQQAIYVLASLKFSLGKSQEAIALYRQTIVDDPKIGEGWWRLAYVLRVGGKLDEAREVVRQARAAGASFDERGAQVLNEILPLAAEATGTAS